jgi:hypothetical protein
VQTTSSSSVRTSANEVSSSSLSSMQSAEPTRLVGIGSVSEQEALQSKIDNGIRLTPLEQGKYERLSTLGQAADGQIYPANHRSSEGEVSSRACTASSSLTDRVLGLFSTEPKTIDNFNISNATEQDIADLEDTLEYLQSTDANGNWKSETAVDLLASLPDCTAINMNHIGVTAVFEPTGGLVWDPRGAMLIEEGGFQSAALGLAHEIDHLVNGEERIPTDDGYLDTEERRVITGSEAQIAKDLGEPMRYSHEGTSYRGVTSSTQSAMGL